jgi:hypothetical protein
MKKGRKNGFLQGKRGKMKKRDEGTRQIKVRK